MSLLERDVQPGARPALILLLLINLFNYIDRYVLAAVLPKIEESFLTPDDKYATTKLGALTMGFLVSYMILSPLFGWLADRASRWHLVGIGVILWSLASGASGLASLAPVAIGYWMLLATRCFVGVGEAAYGPVAPTLISDMYRVGARGKVLACFFAAIPVGSALGYVLGGLVQEDLGWPWAFYLVVPPGILLGLVCFFMREPVRGQADVPVGTPHPGDNKQATLPADAPPCPQKKTFSWQDYAILFKTPSYVLNTLGMTAMTFAVGGMSIFMPYYIYERQGRCQLTAEVMQKLSTSIDFPKDVTSKLTKSVGKEPMSPKEFRHDIRPNLTEAEWEKYGSKLINACCPTSLAEINNIFGPIVVVSGLFATLLGGWLGDVLRPRFPGSYFLVSGLSMLVGFPMILLVLWLPFPLAWVFVFLAVFFLFVNTGPTNTILANVTHPSVRASGYALNILVIHAFGDAISPTVIGFITDISNMDIAMGAVSAVVLIGGVFWLWGTKHLERDTAMAPARINA